MFGALMAAFMGVSPFVANVAGRRADAAFSRAAQAQRATLRQVPATLLQAAPAHRHGAREVPDTPAQWQGPDGLSAGRAGRGGKRAMAAMAGRDRQSRRAGPGSGRGGFAAGLGVIGWLTRQNLARRQQAA